MLFCYSQLDSFVHTLCCCDWAVLESSSRGLSEILVWTKTEEPFAHEQCYVALSRVRSKYDVRIFYLRENICKEGDTEIPVITNVVYPRVLLPESYIWFKLNINNIYTMKKLSLGLTIFDQSYGVEEQQIKNVSGVSGAMHYIICDASPAKFKKKPGLKNLFFLNWACLDKLKTGILGISRNLE